jgi:ubiquinone biosynthesis protein Coq4
VLQSALNGKFVMNIYFEKEIETDIEVLRKKLKIHRIRD